MVSGVLLPTGSEEKGVLGVGSIPVAILFSCQAVFEIKGAHCARCAQFGCRVHTF